MGRRNKYHKIEASDFYDYFEGNLSKKDRNAFERQLQKDLFESDAADGLSTVSREESEQDLQFTSGKIKRRINRTKRIAWYSAAAAIASILVVATVFLNVDDTSMDKYKSAPEMSEMEKKQTEAMKEIAEGGEDISEEVGTEKDAEGGAEGLDPEMEIPLEELEEKDDIVAETITEVEDIDQAEDFIEEDMEMDAAFAMEMAEEEEVDIPDMDMGKGDANEGAVAYEEASTDDIVIEEVAAAAPEMIQNVQDDKVLANQSSRRAAKSVSMTNVAMTDTEFEEDLQGQAEGISAADLSESVIVESGSPKDGITAYREYINTNLVYPTEAPEIENPVVVLTFSVTPEGRPIDFNILNSPSQLFSDAAIHVIEEGPDWIPSQENNGLVMMKILFEK